MEPEANASAHLPACQCSHTKTGYRLCGHIITTIVRSEEFQKECSDEPFPYPLVDDFCPGCLLSNTSYSSASGNSNPREIACSALPENCSADSSPAPTQTGEKFMKSLGFDPKIGEQNIRNFEDVSASNEGVKKVEEANRQLKKLIATLTFTGDMEKIFDEAEKTLERAHGVWLKQKADEEVLMIVDAAKRGDDMEVGRLISAFRDTGMSLKRELGFSLWASKMDVIKQCEEGVERMLGALEQTSL